MSIHFTRLHSFCLCSFFRAHVYIYVYTSCNVNYTHIYKEYDFVCKFTYMYAERSLHLHAYVICMLHSMSFVRSVCIVCIAQNPRSAALQIFSLSFKHCMHFMHNLAEPKYRCITFGKAHGLDRHLHACISKKSGRNSTKFRVKMRLKRQKIAFSQGFRDASVSCVKKHAFCKVLSCDVEKSMRKYQDVAKKHAQ